MAEGTYLDYCATAPVRPEVADAMAPYLRGAFGNPGSVHAFGRDARRGVDDARDQVAALIHADARDIVFTSGGTESDNLAIRGAVAASTRARRRIVVSAVEHHAVLECAAYVRAHDGVDVVTVRVDANGLAGVEDVAAAVDDDTVLVSVMHGNNETGAIQPVDAIAEVCAARGVVYHCDAVQSVGRVPIDVRRWPVGLLAISGHKLGAPKGVGACYIRGGVTIAAQAVGGGQERGRRAGTENVAGIVGLGAACALARAECERERLRIAALRDALERGVLDRVPGAYVNGGREGRLPHVLNVGFPGADGESLVLALDTQGIAVSSGAACAAGALEPSHVLMAMGQSREAAQSAVRFSLGHGTTAAEIDAVLAMLPGIVARAKPRGGPE